MGGLYTWSSSDSGETVAMNLSYGEFFYSHSTELSQTGLRNYDSSQTIDSTTATIDNYKLQMVGFPVHTTDKKVRCDYNFRIQSAPLNSTWGGQHLGWRIKCFWQYKWRAYNDIAWPSVRHNSKSNHLNGCAPRQFYYNEYD